MPLIRRFLIARSITRLIRKEFGSERVIEGHFPPRGERQSHVRIEKGQADLVLTSLTGDPENDEDWSAVPMAHGEALLDVCPGTLTIERTVVPGQSQTAFVDRFVSPGSLDLVSVEFSSQLGAAGFIPPVWLGTEVTHDDTYTNRVMALSGWPSALETEATNVALEAVLDFVESAPGDAAVEIADTRQLGSSAADDDSGEPHRPLLLASAPRASWREFEVESRGRVLPTSPRPPESNGDPLTGVIEGLSAALVNPQERRRR